MNGGLEGGDKGRGMGWDMCFFRARVRTEYTDRGANERCQLPSDLIIIGGGISTKSVWPWWGGEDF
jgi:hypothetical protein